MTTFFEHRDGCSRIDEWFSRHAFTQLQAEVRLLQSEAALEAGLDDTAEVSGLYGHVPPLAVCLWKNESMPVLDSKLFVPLSDWQRYATLAAVVAGEGHLQALRARAALLLALAHMSMGTDLDVIDEQLATWLPTLMRDGKMKASPQGDYNASTF